MKGRHEGHLRVNGMRELTEGWRRATGPRRIFMVSRFDGKGLNPSYCQRGGNDTDNPY